MNNIAASIVGELIDNRLLSDSGIPAAIAIVEKHLPIPSDDLRVQIRETVGQAILKGLQGGEVNAALIGKAMEYLDGKGQKEGTAGEPQDPTEAAMDRLRKARAAGGKMPSMSADEDE